MKTGKIWVIIIVILISFAILLKFGSTIINRLSPSQVTRPESKVQTSSDICDPCGGLASPDVQVPVCKQGLTCVFPEGLFDAPGKCVPEGKNINLCSTNKIEEEKYSCKTDADCICGLDKTTNQCNPAINKNFATPTLKCKQMPDLCSGLNGKCYAGCVNNKCTFVCNR